jgi:uncharacterized phage protein (TIGR02218 family)
MLLFVLRDGSKYAITDHNKDIDFDLTDVAGGSLTYSSRSGFRISDLQTGYGLEPGNYEVTGPIGDIVEREALMGGRWRWAAAYLFEVNWKNPVDPIAMQLGRIAVGTPMGGQFKFEIRDLRDKYAEQVGYYVVNQCSRDFDACCVNIAPETDTTVTAVTSTLQFDIADTLTAADFVNGKVTFTSGDLDGTDPVEIFNISGNTVTLFEPLVALPAIGDALTAKEGCDGTLEMCRDRFSNAVNRRHAYDAVRGNKILQPAIPGQGNSDD